MNERLLAHVLFVIGMGTMSLMGFFGPRWAEAGPVLRVGFVVGVVATVVALVLDVKHRREDKRPASDAGGGAA